MTETYFIKKLAALEITASHYSSNIIQYATNWLSDKIKQPDLLFQPIDPKNIKNGKFYFLYYDLKSNNKMVMYSPVFLIDTKFTKYGTVFYGISLNFLPIKQRYLFFNEIFQNYDKTFYEMETFNNSSKELPIEIPAQYIYDILKSMGFEWAIREFLLSRMNKLIIEKAYEISFQDMCKFCSFDSSVLTGVKESQLAQIWQKKIKEQSEREREQLLHLMENGVKTPELIETYNRNHPSMNEKQIKAFLKKLK